MKREELKKQLEICEGEKKEYLDGWKRAKADLINHKKDEFRRVEEVINREKKEVFVKILLILDNFVRAAKEVEKQEELNHTTEGFLKIKGQLESFLIEEGIEEIKTVGEEFDPFYHEAVETVESETVESGMIAEELQKGYLYKNEVLRPAKVKVVK